MASINKLVSTAQKLGISLERDIDGLERILEKWMRKQQTFNSSYDRSYVSSIILDTPPEYDPKEEAWIQEAWL